MANDYVNSLVSIMARDPLRDVELKIKQVEESGNNKTVLWFQVAVGDLVSRSKDSQVHLQILEFHKRRSVASPPVMNIKDSQGFEFAENTYFLSPYKVAKQSMEILIARNKLSGHSEKENVK